MVWVGWIAFIGIGLTAIWCAFAGRLTVGEAGALVAAGAPASFGLGLLAVGAIGLPFLGVGLLCLVAWRGRLGRTNPEARATELGEIGPARGELATVLTTALPTSVFLSLLITKAVAHEGAPIWVVPTLAPIVVAIVAWVLVHRRFDGMRIIASEGATILPGTPLRILIGCGSAFLLLSLGGAQLIGAPVTVPALWWAARTTRSRIGWGLLLLVGGLTMWSVGVYLGYRLGVEERPSERIGVCVAIGSVLFFAATTASRDRRRRT